MNTADTFKMKMLADRQCVAVSAAVLAADKSSLRRLGQGAFNEYANRLSSLMRESIVESDDFGNDFEDVSAEVTSPMRYAHHLINDCGVAVISAQDEEDGVHIKPVEVKFNDRRLVSNIGAYCADGNLETFAARAETQVKSTANELVKANAEARYKAGFDVKITRTGADRCCDWCAERIGQWTIDNAPDGVFGCHDNCKCTVEYRNSKGVTSRRTGRVGAFVEVDYKPHVGIVQGDEISPRVLTNGANGGKLFLKSSSEIYFARVDGAGKVEKKLLADFKAEYDKFTSVFGQLSRLIGFNVAGYRGGSTFGFYNPNSREITLIGVGGKDGKAFMSEIAKKEYKQGMWSTGSPYHCFRHELGHALQEELKYTDKNWEKKRQQINEIFTSHKYQLSNMFDSEKKEFFKKTLSEYGYTNVDEFVSESVAEYINSPKKARETAKRVVSILMGE